MEKNVVVVIDGGLASTVLATELKAKGFIVSAMSFKTELSNPKNLEMIDKLVKHLDIEHHMIDAIGMTYMFEDTLTEYLYVTTFQVALARRINADIYSPAYRGDVFGNLPATLSKSIFLGSDKEVRLQVPYLRMTIKDIVKVGIGVNTPFELSWSCEGKGDSPCEECVKCLERQEAFVNSNKKDSGSSNPEFATSMDAMDHRSKTETSPRVMTQPTEIPEVRIPAKNVVERTPDVPISDKTPPPKTTLEEAASDALPSDQRLPETETEPVNLPPVPEGTPEALEPSAPVKTETSPADKMAKP